MALLRLCGLVATIMLAAGCSQEEQHPSAADQGRVQGFRFVHASAELRAKCRTTARTLGYPVRCPTRVPAGLFSSGGLDLIGAAEHPSWRGWVVGSGEVGHQHLVLTASPKQLHSYAKVVNGPGWYAAARVRYLHTLVVNGRRMHAILVPPATNDGSAFAGHVTLIWTEEGHTYAIGFHNVRGIRRTQELNVVLARGIRLVGPDRGALRR